MTDNIRFSILVPVYNAEAYIRQCIDSVLAQSYCNFELILVDDGSPDSCGAICDEYAMGDERVRVFHKANGGAFQSRCFALEKAEGDYILFVDSDDYIAGNTLETLVKNIEQYEPDCIIYGLEWLKPGGTESVLCPPEYVGRLITDKREVLNLVMNDASYNSLCRKCVKAACFDGRDFSGFYHIKSGEDRVQSEEILENAESFLFIPDSPYYYRVNQVSVTHSIKYDGYRASFEVEQRSLDLLKKLDVFTQADYDRFRNYLLDALAIELKRISRFCSDKANMRAAMASIRAADFYRDFLRQGYKKTDAVPGVRLASGVRRLLNRVLVTALKWGRYDLIIFISRNIFK